MDGAPPTPIKEGWLEGPSPKECVLSRKWTAVPSLSPFGSGFLSCACLLTFSLSAHTHWGRPRAPCVWDPFKQVSGSGRQGPALLICPQCSCNVSNKGYVCPSRSPEWFLQLMRMSGRDPRAFLPRYINQVTKINITRCHRFIPHASWYGAVLRNLQIMRKHQWNWLIL